MSDLSEQIKLTLEDRAGADAGDLAVAGIYAVLDLHARGEAHRTFGDRRPVCQACDDGRSRPVWPCPTITLMASAVGVPAALGVSVEGKD